MKSLRSLTMGESEEGTKTLARMKSLARPDKNKVTYVAQTEDESKIHVSGRLDVTVMRASGLPGEFLGQKWRRRVKLVSWFAALPTTHVSKGSEQTIEHTTPVPMIRLNRQNPRAYLTYEDDEENEYRVKSSCCKVPFQSQ